MSESFQVFLIFEGKTYTQMVTKSNTILEIMLLITKKFKLPYMYSDEDFKYKFPFYLTTNAKPICFTKYTTINNFNEINPSKKIYKESCIYVKINFHSKIWNRAQIINK